MVVGQSGEQILEGVVLKVAVLEVQQSEPRVLLQDGLRNEDLLATQVVVAQHQFLEEGVAHETVQQLGGPVRGDLELASNLIGGEVEALQVTAHGVGVLAQHGVEVLQLLVLDQVVGQVQVLQAREVQHLAQLLRALDHVVAHVQRYQTAVVLQPPPDHFQSRVPDLGARHVQELQHPVHLQRLF